MILLLQRLCIKPCINMNKIVTFGEIMLRLSASDYLRLTQSNQLNVSFAGAEANVAVSLANYGIPVEYVTCLPDNPMADKCLKELRGIMCLLIIA